MALEVNTAHLRRMNGQVKAAWLEALRSGQYGQTTGVLCRPSMDLDRKKNSYCCLGVLQHIAGYRESDDAEMIDYDQANAIGISQKIQADLAKMNDNGASFEEIADWIEANL